MSEQKHTFLPSLSCDVASRTFSLYKRRTGLQGRVSKINIILIWNFHCIRRGSFLLKGTAMNGSLSDWNALEDSWRRPVENAGLRLDFTRAFVEEVQRDVAAHAVPAADGAFSYQTALHAQNVAAVEYGRLLPIYADLVVNGKPPAEGEWAAHAETA